MPTSTIGTLRENSLHAEIKNWYRRAGDGLEVNVRGYLIDLVREEILIEIQTSHFYSLREKLSKLLPDHPIRLVYPLPVYKWVTRCDIYGEVMIGRRRSPKHQQICCVFDELIYLPNEFLHRNFSLEVLLIEQEDIWFNDGKGSWRRKYWSIADRKLLAVLDRALFTSPEDFYKLLPDSLPNKFTSLDLSAGLGISRSLAGKMLYCLHKMSRVEIVGSKNRSRIYSIR